MYYLIWLSPIQIRKEGVWTPFSGKTTSGVGFLVHHPLGHCITSDPRQVHANHSCDWLAMKTTMNRYNHLEVGGHPALGCFETGIAPDDCTKHDRIALPLFDVNDCQVRGHSLECYLKVYTSLKLWYIRIYHKMFQSISHFAVSFYRSLERNQYDSALLSWAQFLLYNSTLPLSSLSSAYKCIYNSSVLLERWFRTAWSQHAAYSITLYSNTYNLGCWNRKGQACVALCPKLHT